MRNGACVIAEPLALIRARPDSYSQTMRDVPQQTKVLNTLLDLLAQPQLRDIRDFMKDCPSNLAVYDPLIFKVLSKRPRDWDLFATYARWKMRDHGQQARNAIRSLAGRFRQAVRKGLDTARRGTS